MSLMIGLYASNEDRSLKIMANAKSIPIGNAYISFFIFGYRFGDLVSEIYTYISHCVSLRLGISNSVRSCHVYIV